MTNPQQLPQTHRGPRPHLLPVAALLLTLLASGPLACGPRHLVEEPVPAAPEELRRWSELSKSGRSDLLFHRYEEAEKKFEAALELSREYRPSDVRRRSSLGNLERLATAYWKAGRRRDFDRVMELLLEAAPEVPTYQTETLTDGLLLLGVRKRSQGDLEVSREALELALSISTQMAGERDIGVARIHMELGLTCLDSGDLDRAERELTETLDIIEESAGRESRAYAGVLIAMAKLHEAQQRGDVAETEFRRAVELNRAAGGASHNATMNAMVALARFYQRQNRMDDAEATFKEMVAAQREADETTLSYVQGLNALAWFYVDTGRPGEAEAPARAALETLDSMNVGGASRATVLDTLATSLRDRGLYPEAEKLYLQAIEESRGGTRPGEADEIVGRYAELLRQQGRGAEADQLLEKLRDPSLDSGQAGSHVGVTPEVGEAEQQSGRD